jgi:hypothetical protein
MKFASYNIQYGLGQDGRYDLHRIASAVEEADVIALQEVERFWQRSGMVDQPAELARLLPEHHWVYGANLDMDASYRDDSGRLVNRRRQFGTMLMSRWPILSSRNFPLPKLGLSESHSIQQGILEGVWTPRWVRSASIPSISATSRPRRACRRCARSSICTPARRRRAGHGAAAIPIRTAAGPRARCPRCRARPS